MLSEQIKEVVDSVYEGWYAGESRIDWEDFLYRVEALGDIDLGTNAMSEEIKEIKAYVRKLRRS